MARAESIIKKDRHAFKSALINASVCYTKERMAMIEMLHEDAEKAVQQLERAPMIYANEIGASDKLCRAYQNARMLCLALSMAKDAALYMESDINAAYAICEKSEQENVERVVHEASKKAKKEYDKARYLKKKEEAGND